MKRVIVGFLVIILSLLIKSCDTTDPPDNKSLTLKLEDVSCTEAWIELTTTNLQLPATITLKQTNPTGDTKSQIINLNTKDSLLYIDSLLPNKSYQYQASSIKNPANSNELSVTTLDTTSHNFTFETFTFGGTAGSSTLYDVAIINENNIWAVGEIMVADTSINGYTTYNAVHWDGSEWELKRIPYYYQGQPFYHPIQSVFAFGSNDIWFCGNGVIYWDGNNFIPVPIPSIVWGPYQMNKLWGSSSNDLYVVGNGGNIARYLNGTWSRIESGTELNIYDIFGEYNNSKSDFEINLVAAQQYVGPERKILTIRNNTVEEISTTNISQGSIHGIWFNAGRKYFVVGNGIFTKKNICDFNNWDASLVVLTPYYAYAIRGSGLNNIFICGSYGELLHFGGASWKSFKNTPGFYDAEFFNVETKDRLVAVVGQRFSSGFITIGKLH